MVKIKQVKYIAVMVFFCCSIFYVEKFSYGRQITYCIFMQNMLC